MERVPVMENEKGGQVVPIQVWMSETGFCGRRVVHNTSTGICKMSAAKCSLGSVFLSLTWDSCPKRLWCFTVSAGTAFPFLGWQKRTFECWELWALHVIPVCKGCKQLCSRGNESGGVIYNNKAEMKAVPGENLTIFQCISRAHSCLQFYRWQLNQRWKLNSFIIKSLPLNFI